MRNKKYKIPHIIMPLNYSVNHEPLYVKVDGVWDNNAGGTLTACSNGRYSANFNRRVYSYNPVKISTEFKTKSGIIFKSVKLKNIAVRYIYIQTYLFSIGI